MNWTNGNNPNAVNLGLNGNNNDVEQVGNIFAELHCKVSWRELPDVYGPITSETRKRLINTVSSEDAAIGVEECVQEYLRSTGFTITTFRASMLYPFGQDDRAWPVMEWTDNQGGEVLAIFETDVPPGPDICSWI